MNTRTHYTDAEQAKLRQLYGKISMDDLLLAFPKRTEQGLRNHARKLGICKNSTTIAWSPAEDAILRQHYASSGPTAVTKRLTRSLQAVKQRASRLGITMDIALRPTPASKLPRATEHSPVPKAANTLRPLLVGAKPEPVKRSPNTPVLNARINARSLAQKQDKQPGYVSADEIKRLGPNHPARIAYTRAAHQGMPAAQAAYHEAMANYQKAA